MALLRGLLELVAESFVRPNGAEESAPFFCEWLIAMAKWAASLLPHLRRFATNRGQLTYTLWCAQPRPNS